MKHWIFILVSLLVLAAPSQAQDIGVEVEASISPPQAYVGSTFTYTVSVNSIGQRDVSQPTLDLPPSLRVLSSGENYQSRTGRIQDSNGTTRLAQVVTQSYYYVLSSSQAGTLTIPPATITVDGKPMQTNTVSVRIIEPEEIEGFSLEARLSKPRAYAGEPVTLRLTWITQPGVRNYAIGASQLPPGVEAEPINPPAAFRDRSGRYVQFDLFGKTIFGTVMPVNRNGETMASVTLELKIRATQPGSVDLGPFAITFDTPGRSGFGSQRGVTRSNIVRLEARPLPAEGKPADFAGLIGNYRIDATASPTDVRIGDPIALQVEVRGSDPLAVQEGPRLDADPAFADSFKLDPGGWQRDPTGREQARFKTTIRALDANLTQIPPVRLAYFDPDAGEYRVATSEPIPLSVHAASTVTLADAVTSSMLPPAGREQISQPAGGLWSIAASPALIPRGRGFDSDALFLVFIVVPPLLLLTQIAGRAVRRHWCDPARLDRRAYAQARRLARRGQVEQAVRMFLARRLSQHPAAVTAADCGRVTSDPQAAALLARCLMVSEVARFGGPSVAAEVRGEELDKVLRQLRRGRGANT
ncbi:MAG: hypothetical protein Kow0022_13710 [Phycisphaerales bacterium]